MNKSVLALACLLAGAVLAAAQASSSASSKKSRKLGKDAGSVAMSTATARGGRRLDPKDDLSLAGGIVMSSGALKVMMPQGPVDMKNDWTMSDGTRVLMTGQVLKSSGTVPVTLREGDMVLPDGTIQRKPR